jgi:endoglucanase
MARPRLIVLFIAVVLSTVSALTLTLGNRSVKAEAAAGATTDTAAQQADEEAATVKQEEARRQAAQQAVQAAKVAQAAAELAASLQKDATVQNTLPSSSAVRSSSGLNLYIDPVLRQNGRPERIASQPIATWFGGWNGNVQADVDALVTKASAANATATLVAYNIPSRDCGSYSAGGANSSAGYRSWIQAFAAGIGSRAAIVILEPDALPGIECLPVAGQAQRLSDLSFAVNVLSGTGAITYIDAGNYSWQPVSVMAQRLKAANVANARGVSLNVSGYGWTDKSIAYGNQLVAALGGGKGFVIDTSRNGNGPAPGNEWCNPRGRALGVVPSTRTGVANVDAYLWAKVPGESDGACNGGPSAGQWWDDIANELIANAH